MKKKFAHFQIALKLLPRKGDKVLILKDKRGYMDFAGGRIDVGEEELPLYKIIQREVREELGKDFRYRLGKPLFQYRKYARRSKMFGLVTVYDAQYLGGDIKLSFEHTRYEWVRLRDLKIAKNSDATEKEKLFALRQYINSLYWRKPKKFKKSPPSSTEVLPK